MVKTKVKMRKVMKKGRKLLRMMIIIQKFRPIMLVYKLKLTKQLIKIAKRE